MSTSQAHFVFLAIFAWFMLALSGCRTTDQYGCTPRQNRLATKAYYKGMSKCPRRFDLLYRSDHPIHDSSYTHTEYLPGEIRTETNTVYQSDTVRVGDTLYITKTITITNEHNKVDTARQTQYNTRTITVRDQQQNNGIPWWMWVWALVSTGVILLLAYFLVLALRAKR